MKIVVIGGTGLIGSKVENGIFSRREPARRETGLSPHYWEPCGTKLAKNVAEEKPFDL